MKTTRSDKTDSANGDTPPVRLDKWLWATRFFKTRSLASDAVSGGMVSVNGERAKASKATKVGDEVIVRRGQFVYTLIVKALSDKRRGAAEAQALYEETEDSVARRKETAELNRANALPDNRPRLGRPSKRDRRQINRFRGR